jgi:hypothetical protein
MNTVKARFDGRVFVPEEPVDLPVGHILEIPINPPAAANSNGQGPLDELLQTLNQLPTNPHWPADGAAQHDHYLYGTPKTS